MSTMPASAVARDEMEAESPARLLFNPSPRFIKAGYSGMEYLLKPESDEAVDPATDKVGSFDGVTAIRDHWGFEWAKDSDSGAMVPTGNRRLFFSSIDIATHILKEFGARGVVRLTGDPKKDEALKEEARKAWVRFQVKWAKDAIAGRDAYLRSFHANPANAGQIPDPPSELDNEAYEVIAAFRVGELGRKAFACMHDGYQTDDEKKWANHQRAMHPAEPSGTTGAAQVKGGKSRPSAQA